MKFLVNPSLPLKYHLDCHVSLSEYPTKSDFMFDMISYIVRVYEAKPKVWDPNDIKFSMKTLKYVFGDKMTPEFIDKLKSIMRSLVEDGTLNVKGEFINISEDVFTNYYSLIN